MKPNGVFPNLYAYNCMINECCNYGTKSKGLELLDEMCRRCVICNVFTYNTLVGVLCQESLGGWEVDGSNGKHLIISKFNYLKHPDRCVCIVGKLEKAACLFNQLQSIGQSPTLVTYNVLIAGFCWVENLVSCWFRQGDGGERNFFF